MGRQRDVGACCSAPQRDFNAPTPNDGRAGGQARRRAAEQAGSRAGGQPGRRAAEALWLLALWDGLQFKWMYAPDEIDIGAHLTAHLNQVLTG
ncbi:hypothetical protein [Microbacterium sp.]|uniref:hypothetical protein n=1 Tax=Microbacterium sp. TaxID=51671 RepID=UPI0025D41B0D|nr:hypothetical protein [Microbacterium sp.]